MNAGCPDRDRASSNACRAPLRQLLGEWSRTRDAIFTDIVERGWNSKRGSFIQNRDGEVLDASVLLMPMVKLLAPTDPRFTSTLAAVERDCRVALRLTGGESVLNVRSRPREQEVRKTG